MHEIGPILEIIASISSTLALDEILAEITEKTAQIVGADSCAISRWDRKNDTIIVLADYISPQVALPPGEDIYDVGVAYPLASYPATAHVLHEHIPVIIYTSDPMADKTEENLLKTFQWDGVLMVPMLYKGQAIGLMELYTDDRLHYQFTEDKIALCQALANQAAVAIENARLFAELEAQRETLRQVSLRLVNAQEDERRRLSRELHDELGQALTALKINLDMARRTLPANAPPKLRRNIDEASWLAGQTQERTRSLSLALHPPILDDLGLISALHWELDCYEQRFGQTIYFEADLVDTVLPPELEITIYRIISEALTNVARHAQASHVRIYVRAENHHIVAGVEDDGVGFDASGWFDSPLERQSLGLISMRERAQLLGGQLLVTSKPKRGTRVRAQFPIIK